MVLWRSPQKDKDGSFDMLALVVAWCVAFDFVLLNWLGEGVVICSCLMAIASYSHLTNLGLEARLQLSKSISELPL